MSDAITVLFHVPKVGYTTFYDGGDKFETGHGFPTAKHPVWDASHFDLTAKAHFMKEVCNGRGGVDDLTRLQDFLAAWGCKPVDVQTAQNVFVSGRRSGKTLSQLTRLGIVQDE